MIKRIVDISKPSYLRLKHTQLIVEQDHEKVAAISVEDLGVLILQHPAITITQSLLIACQENNVVVVFCDAKHLPYSVLLPLVEANSLHSKVLKEQISSTLPRSKRIWQSVVATKIKYQCQTLEKQGIQDQQLKRLAKKVKSVDLDNYEAQAARRYWRLLFGDKFRRDVNEDGVNSLLNYGYAVVRAMTARAIVAGGLHPSLGIHHRNQYNSLNLADDLMEPFRPWVDSIVAKLAYNEKTEVNAESKAALLSLPSKIVLMGDERMPLMVSMHYLIAQFKKALADKSIKLVYPRLLSE